MINLQWSYDRSFTCLVSGWNIFSHIGQKMTRAQTFAILLRVPDMLLCASNNVVLPADCTTNTLQTWCEWKRVVAPKSGAGNSCLTGGVQCCANSCNAWFVPTDALMLKIVKLIISSCVSVVDLPLKYGSENQRTFFRKADERNESQTNRSTRTIQRYTWRMTFLWLVPPCGLPLFSFTGSFVHCDSALWASPEVESKSKM